LNEAARIVSSYGGSLSGEHGDGQARGALLPIMFGDELTQAFREFKSAWDPRGRMNPGKVVDAYPVDRNLRWGTHYHPWDPPTEFTFAADDGSFAIAADRCVGTGKCRKHDGGTMCPSYMATREEKHSTRGRARLLFEMFEGNPLRHGWREGAVKEALDLCLACKACRAECPVNVDMATYKAEFLSHYYRGHPRPMSAYAFGLMHWWARAAAVAPGVANFFTQTPGLRDIAKRVVSIAPERHIPRFARRTFRALFRRRHQSQVGQPVMLWVDTWNDHFHPGTLLAATDVLEAAGFRVTIPDRPLCCGRPLYDWGMLGTAKKLLQRTLDSLREPLRAGVPIVGLEPSCISVFRDELVQLWPDDEDATRLHDQSFTMTEFLDKHAPAFAPPLEARAVLHGHCHDKSVLDFGSHKRVLERMRTQVDVLDSGCCGMAGAFGFERGEHYRVSVACGERVLLPAVRQAPESTLVVADGFSCREQIAQQTGRRALHVAEVIKLAVGRRRA
jgi:Fe-S oxidoreductase